MGDLHAGDVCSWGELLLLFVLFVLDGIEDSRLRLLSVFCVCLLQYMEILTLSLPLQDLIRYHECVFW